MEFAKRVTVPPGDTPDVVDIRKGKKSSDVYGETPWPLPNFNAFQNSFALQGIKAPDGGLPWQKPGFREQAEGLQQAGNTGYTIAEEAPERPSGPAFGLNAFEMMARAMADQRSADGFRNHHNLGDGDHNQIRGELDDKSNQWFEAIMERIRQAQAQRQGQ